MIIQVIIKYWTYLIIHINYWSNYIYLGGCVDSNMLLFHACQQEIKAVLNENRARVYVGPKRVGAKLDSRWLIESDTSSRSFPGISLFQTCLTRETLLLSMFPTFHSFLILIILFMFHNWFSMPYVSPITFCRFCRMQKLVPFNTFKIIAFKQAVQSSCCLLISYVFIK